MAQAKTIKFGQSLIEIGDGGTVETFAAPCGFESVSMVINTEVNTSNVPDCSDPDLPAWLLSDIVSKQMVLSGEGFFDSDAWKDIWREWAMDGDEKNVRFHIDLSAANGGGYFSAAAHLTTFEFNGERGQRGRINIGITLQGKPTWTAAV